MLAGAGFLSGTSRQQEGPMKESYSIDSLIFTIRGHKVLLDADLAQLYGVSTKRFNEAFKRNRQRFPDEFAFQLTTVEFKNLRSQIATSSLQPIDNKKDIIFTQLLK